MKVETHHLNNLKIAELISEEIIIKSVEDGLQLLGNLYYQGFDKIIIYKQNITPAFFDLKTKIAGELLQKFTQYKMPLAIVGNFTKYESKSLNDFIYETNKGRQINFVRTLPEAIKI
ncbi:MAG: DUF4180 domain-containing protein [Sphingobacteriales bacterium]|jgi:hypothetical protein|nr:DUF4180 domain-containing protein [Sphingobacteriales bacterium]MBP9141230.1 DUF4180 domain-containing protein [Chitinophagales bacterium]MDA0199277.1 DUF4180 domain-containing protein [Bacteroidota bacterium]MBK6890453.1 DUF4180 domain-containing protein [Sphingobacteriales bacterium]MBK7526495.1 DUF4180 domain-containing protein [Sphingobacteriales bacterium]